MENDREQNGDMPLTAQDAGLEDAGTEPMPEAADMVQETAAEEVIVNEETVGDESDEDAAPARKKKVRRRIYMTKSNIEWVATCAFCTFILYLGYRLGSLAQSGYTGKTMLAHLLSGYGSLVTLVLTLFFAFITQTMGRRGLAWLTIPAVLFSLFSVYEAWVFGSVWLVYRNYVYALYFGAYVVQMIVYILFALYVVGRMPKGVLLGFTLVWMLGFGTFSVLGMQGLTFAAMTPQIMLLLSYITTALMLTLPVLIGRRVPVQELVALRAQEAASTPQAETSPETADAEAADVKEEEPAPAEAEPVSAEYSEKPENEN